MAKTAEQLINQVAVRIAPPNIITLETIIQGTAPLIIERFSAKADMMLKMQEGDSAKNRKKKTARDFDRDAQQAKYVSAEGWEGFNASAIRNACISACRLVGFKMTVAKLSIFTAADGLSEEDGIPIVRIYGEATTFTQHARNATGVVDIRSRPQYRDWAACLRLEYDGDQFRAQDIINLLQRAGSQVGIGAGRPDSRQSAGCGWGTFRVVNTDQEEEIRQKYGIAMPSGRHG